MIVLNNDSVTERLKGTKRFERGRQCARSARADSGVSIFLLLRKAYCGREISIQYGGDVVEMHNEGPQKNQSDLTTGKIGRRLNLFFVIPAFIFIFINIARVFLNFGLIPSTLSWSYLLLMIESVALIVTATGLYITIYYTLHKKDYLSIIFPKIEPAPLLNTKVWYVVLVTVNALINIYYQNAIQYTWILISLAFFYVRFSIDEYIKNQNVLKENKQSKGKPKPAAESPSLRSDEGADENEQMRVQRLISELSSRENSTLVVSTIAASASLAVLAFSIPIINEPMFNWAFLMGVIFSFVGLLYREVTVLLVDSSDYQILNSRVQPLTPSNTARQVAVFTRMFILRFLLWIPIASWVELKLTDVLQNSMFLSVFTISVIAFVFSFLEHSLRYDP